VACIGICLGSFLACSDQRMNYLARGEVICGVKCDATSTTRHRLQYWEWHHV